MIAISLSDKEILDVEEALDSPDICERSK